jgi:hypothetical protein
MGQAAEEPLYIYDEDRFGGKGLLKACEFVREKLGPCLAGQNCSRPA